MHDPLMVLVLAQKPKDAETELALWLKNDAQKYLLKNDLPVHLFRHAISHELPVLIPGVNLWNEIAVIDKLCTLKESGDLALFVTRVWEEKWLRRYDPMTYKERKRRAGRLGGLAIGAKRRAGRLGGLAIGAKRRRVRDRLARRIVKMRENGKSYKKIQADMGVSADRIHRAIRAAKTMHKAA